MHLASVDFPQPLRPRMPTDSPLYRSKLVSLSTSILFPFLPKDLQRFLTCSSGGSVQASGGRSLSGSVFASMSDRV